MLHPFTPNHVQLISACYPPSAALTGSVVAPNSQELSRLTYYAANKTGKLSKLGIEMEKRVKAEARRAQAGNVRYRSSLLISLQILRSLATECRRDISLLTAPILSSVVTALRALPSDLEASAKAATLFTTWTTFTDGRSVGVEKTVSSDYSAILEIFSQMSMVQDKGSDHEFRNRKRLVGLAALTATVTSEALYSSSIFRQQAPVIVFPLLFNICGTELSVLESDKVKSEASSPYLTEFRTRPANERRAASIHIHKDGEHGPSTSDLVDTSLHALHSLFAHSAGSHITHVIHAVLESLDKRRYWDKQDVCCWLAVKTTEWSSYQHRYAVPTKLIERLVEEQDASSVTSLHNSLVAMITAIFTSSIHLVNLSTSDSISNLLTLIIRRVATSPNDPLLPSLAECIASLGTHIYYSDQIQDLSHEIISRMMTVDANGVQGKEEDKDRGSRTAAIRYLLSALVGLMFAPRRHQAVKEVDSDALNKSPRSADGLPAIETAADKTIWTAKRARVSPETWQDTLHLLCDEEFAVRSDYAYALAFFLRSEMAERKGRVDADTPRKLNSIMEEPGILSRDFVRADGDEKARMLHAMNVYIFAVATATTFRPSSSPPQASPIDYDASPIPSGAAINIVPATPVATPPAFGDHDSSPFRRPSISVSVNMRARRQSTGKKVLLHLPSRWSASQVPKASASDYRSLLDLLSALHENSPLRGLILGVPVLVALDSFIHDVGDVDELKGHVVALREVLARAWLTIGRVWECEDLIILTEKSLSSLPGSTVLPPSVHSDDAGKGAFLTTGEAMPVPDAEATWAGVDSAAALDALLSRREAFEKAGLNPDTLAERLRAPWSPQTAWTNSMEPQSGLDPLRGDSASGRIRLSSSLMLSENMSLQSLNKSSRGVGVSDLRQALEGRSSLSNPNLAPSFSTSFESDALRPSRAARPDRHKLRNDPKEVHEVLNKLKVGKSPTGSSALLKASFPALRKPVESQSDGSAIAPPYKT